MSRFVSHVVTDLRSGHETWRIYIAFGSLAFAAGVLNSVIR